MATQDMFAQQIIKLDDIEKKQDTEEKQPKWQKWIKLKLEIDVDKKYLEKDKTPTLPEFIKWKEENCKNKSIFKKFIFLLSSIILYTFVISDLIITLLFVLDFHSFIFAIISQNKNLLANYASSLINNFIEFPKAVPGQLLIIFPILYIFSLIAFYSIVPLLYHSIHIKLEDLLGLKKPKKQLSILKDILLDLDGIPISKLENDISIDDKKLSYSYVSPRNKHFKLKGIDPDWELEQIIMGFLPNIDLYVFVSLFLSFIVLIFAIIDSILLDDFFTFLFYALIPIFYILFRGITYIRAIITYNLVMKKIEESLRQEVIKLSTAETKILDTKNTTLDEIDAKLDLASARQSLENIKIAPKFPYYTLIYRTIRWVAVLSLIVTAISPFIM